MEASELFMYQKKDTNCFMIAIVYWIAYSMGLFLSGYLYTNELMMYGNMVYCALFFIGVLIVIIKDKDITHLGFTKEKLKINLIISFVIIILTFFISVFLQKYPIPQLIKKSLYYLFYIGLIEEVLFRGFIQNYLFGLQCNKFIVFTIGGLLFSLMHLPFQMIIHNNVSLGYILKAYPQLIDTFIFHLVMCFITYKRKDITIPTALHYVVNYLGDFL